MTDDASENDMPKIYADEDMTLHLESLSKITIDNILDIKSYLISRDGDLTTHKITLRNGGQFRFSYTAAGKIMAFEGHHMRTTIRDGSQVILRPIEE